MIQQFHYWAYTLRKPYLEEIRVPQCLLQRFLQWLGHGSSLDVQQQMNGYRNCADTILCRHNIYSGMLLNFINEHIWVSPNEVDEPRAYCTKWS